MMKATSLFLFLLCVPMAAQKLFIYPKIAIAPRGTYQSVTAIITGVSNKTVTWSASGGKLVGTNPCVVNEPCTIALFSTEAGNLTLKATSNANHEVVATSTVTFAASPTPRTDHPRLMITADMLAMIQQAINELPPKCKMVFKLTKEELDLVYTEITALADNKKGLMDEEIAQLARRSQQTLAPAAL